MDNYRRRFTVQFKDQLDFVRQHVKKNRMRIFTTILATTMGCAFLIVLASVAFGLQSSLKKEVLSDDTLTRIEVYNDGNKEIEPTEIKKMENVNAVTMNTLIQTGNLEANIGEYKGSPEVILTDFKENEKANLKLSKGTYPEKADGVVVGYNVAQILLSKEDEKKLEKEKDASQINIGIQESMIGKKITLNWKNEETKKKVTRTFTIEGVGPKPKKEWEQDGTIRISKENEEALVQDLKTLYGKKLKAEEMIYRTTAVYATDLEAVTAINKALQDEGYATYTVSQQLEEMNLLFLALKAGLIFVGTIAILIASIGIFNTMTMAVTERTREIGVMKAIGASPKLIQRLFVMESAYIGVIGTVIAVIISYIVSFAANYAIPKILYMATNEKEFLTTEIQFSAIPWQLVVIAAAISIGVAILSGWRPARKATKIDVIQALRQD